MYKRYWMHFKNRSPHLYIPLLNVNCHCLCRTGSFGSRLGKMSWWQGQMNIGPICLQGWRSLSHTGGLQQTLYSQEGYSGSGCPALNLGLDLDGLTRRHASFTNLWICDLRGGYNSSEDVESRMCLQKRQVAEEFHLIWSCFCPLSSSSQLQIFWWRGLLKMFLQRSKCSRWLLPLRRHSSFCAGVGYISDWFQPSSEWSIPLH